MVANLQKPVWLVVTLAAFVAQVVPQSWTGDCGRGCCAADAVPCCPATLETPAESPLGCASCSAPASCSTSSDGLPAHADESPCHCQLDARQEQPLTVHGTSSPQSDDLAGWVAADTTSLEALHGLVASRSYEVASLSIPIRPVRILYGVWRN
jgi:hypothetical protein